MPPKKGGDAGGGGGGKGKAKATDDDGDSSGSKLKPATSVKVRHILCEKQSKILEALAMLQEGVSFDKVAEKFSEDKARQGGTYSRAGFMTSNLWLSQSIPFSD